MRYKAFLSHSTRDDLIVTAFANSLRQAGIEVYVSTQNLYPGQNIEGNIFPNIDFSDCVVVLLTRNGLHSNYVQQEIGYAIKAKKLIIPIVEQGTDNQALAAIQRINYIPYNPYNPADSLYKVIDYLSSLKKDKEGKEQGAIVLLGISALLFFAASGDGK
ncbi:MAG: toll/interleukin-1 receptor domain-containing protein [Candidatus Goldbacteria bacterium]|nr:toll/interleukin-1 receptor domain-containing protein [Candidatus Goldiibacteriota bacterium]